MTMPWYAASDLSRNLTQVVLSIPPGSARPSQFAALRLSSHSYPALPRPWSTTFLPLNGTPHPYLLVHADVLADDLRALPLAVGFSFFRFAGGGLFVVFVRVQDTRILARIRQKFPVIQVAALEGLLRLDVEGQARQLENAIRLDALHMVVASDRGVVAESVDPATGRAIRSNLPKAEFDIRVPLPAGMRKRLMEEWASLVAHHALVPHFRRNFKSVALDYERVMPLSADPILKAEEPC